MKSCYFRDGGTHQLLAVLSGAKWRRPDYGHHMQTATTTRKCSHYIAACGCDELHAQTPKNVNTRHNMLMCSVYANFSISEYLEVLRNHDISDSTCSSPTSLPRAGHPRSLAVLRDRRRPLLPTAISLTLYL